MDFVVIDFETANSQRSSPCEIGLTFVENWQIVDTKSWLIKPIGNKFDWFNISIHGITPSMVENMPEFDTLWQEICPLISNKLLIAHNAAFDMSVLRNTLVAYNMPLPTLNYCCSYRLSKKVWEGLDSYSLNRLCSINDIQFKHHRAASDSLATAQLVLKAFEIANIKTVEDLLINLYTAPRSLSNSSKVIGDVSMNNTASIFYEKRVVFTGTLSVMTRNEAHQIIANIGGIVSESVSKNTDYLIVGQQDYRYVGDDGMSTKQEKVIKLIEKGHLIEVLSEFEFLNFIGNSCT